MVAPIRHPGRRLRPFAPRSRARTAGRSASSWRSDTISAMRFVPDAPTPTTARRPRTCTVDGSGLGTASIWHKRDPLQESAYVQSLGIRSGTDQLLDRVVVA